MAVLRSYKEAANVVVPMSTATPYPLSVMELTVILSCDSLSSVMMDCNDSVSLKSTTWPSESATKHAKRIFSDISSFVKKRLSSSDIPVLSFRSLILHFPHLFPPPQGAEKSISGMLFISEYMFGCLRVRVSNSYVLLSVSIFTVISISCGTDK